jgi:hypothetical protein
VNEGGDERVTEWSPFGADPGGKEWRAENTGRGGEEEPVGERARGGGCLEQPVNEDGDERVIKRSPLGSDPGRGGRIVKG